MIVRPSITGAERFQGFKEYQKFEGATEMYVTCHFHWVLHSLAPVRRPSMLVAPPGMNPTAYHRDADGSARKKGYPWVGNCHSLMDMKTTNDYYFND
jgi:hypothetical protein